MRKYGRTDGNQTSIRKSLDALPGVRTVSIASIGDGLPDLIVGYAGKNYLVELKDPTKCPSERRLTPDEQVWHSRWTGQVSVCETFEDVLLVIGITGTARRGVHRHNRIDHNL
jgi:hypothetical protein